MRLTKFLVFTCALILSSCTSDPCEDVTCFNDGVCDDGTCLCAEWYEGIDCGTEERAKYYGDYLGSLIFYYPDGSVSNSLQRSLAISEGRAINEVLFNELPFVFNTSGTSDFIIPVTELEEAGTIVTYEGYGSFVGKLLVMNATLQEQGGQPFSFTFSGLK